MANITEGVHNLIANLETMEGDNDANLIIGSYNRILHGVKIFLGSEPRIDWITNYVFGVNEPDFFGYPPGYPDYHSWVRSKGDVIIENDCFIGYCTIIMSGVTIGTGTTIGACSHVVTSTEPYSIYGGNPARLIKYKFPEDIRTRLLKTKWWELPTEEVNKLIPVLCSNDVEKLFEIFGV